jgi:cytochrome bd-type quinol oxidase subunit 1
LKKSKTILEMLLIDIFFGFIILTGFMAVYNGTAQKLEKAHYLKYNVIGVSYTSYITGNTYGIDDIGRKYTVYYNPSNPSKIVCPNSASSRVLILIILSLVSIILIIFNIRKFSKTSRNKKYKY